MKIYKSRNPFGWSLDHSKSFRIGPNRILNHFVLMILQDQRFKSCYIKLLNRLDVQIILNLESIRLKSRKSYSHVIQKLRNQNDNPMNALTLTLIVKFWKTHPEFFPRFQFSGVTQIDFWKNHPQKFYEYLISKISGHDLCRMSQTDFWKNHP